MPDRTSGFLRAMRSEALPSDPFRCALCGGGEFRVVVRGRMGRQWAAGHGEISLGDYACTSRGHGRFFRVVECRRCRLRALSPAPAKGVIEGAYARVRDDEYLSIERPRRVAFTKLLQRLERFRKPPGTLLDVGCSTGVFPLLAQERGWDAYGVEPSAWAAGIAASRLPGKIHRGYLERAPYEERSFDVIASWDVIEHVADPRKELGLMTRLLKSGGWLLLSTMASEALIVKLLGTRWPWYMPMHLFYFTPKTLGDFARQAGLEPRAVEAYPHYTTVHYVLWKLEALLGAPARWARAAAARSGMDAWVVKVDLKDFFLFAAQKR